MIQTRRFLSAILSILLIPALPWAAQAVQESGPSKAAIAAGPDYMRALETAAAAYAARDFPRALDKLDLADNIQPNIPDTWNMRGAIYAEQHAYEKAADAFEKAGRLNPGDFWPPYNIAQLLLMQKKYTEAAAAFQKLLVYGGHDELVQYKIVFTDLLAGKPEDAKPVLDAMRFPSKTPAYYFAQAAWAFSHKDVKTGNNWTNSGLKIFGREQCMSFYDALAGMGWVAMRNPDGSMPDKVKLLATPEPLATPGSAGF